MMWLFIAIGFVVVAILFALLGGGAEDANIAGLFFILSVLLAASAAGCSLIFVVRSVFRILESGFWW